PHKSDTLRRWFPDPWFEAEDIRACAEALAKHADDPSEGPQCARKLLRALTPEIDLVAHALATHLAEFIQEEKQMELVATALAQHMEEQKIGCDPAQVIAKALLTHAALTFSGEQELLKGYSMEGEATPFRVAKSPAQLLKMHAALRKELLEGIQRQNRVQMRSALNRGASVRAHYYSSRVPARLGKLELEGTAKGPRSSLVNPVDWAVLEGFYQEAIFLLDLTEGHVSFNRDEERSSLQVVQMAKECRQAVVVACQKGQELLLRALLAKGASCLQQDAFERSALHVAALVGDEVAVKLLLERGAWAPEDRKPEVLRLAEAHRMHCIIEAAGVAAGPTINLLNPERPAFQEVIQVLEDTREADRNLTMAELEERSKLAARPRAPVLPGAVEAEEGTTLAEARQQRRELHAQLSKAIRKNDALAVAALVQRGAPIELPFDLGYGEQGTCVDWAVASQRPQVALQLLRLADAKGHGQALAQQAVAALFWSALHGYPEVLEGLLSRGLEVAAARPAPVAPLCTTGSALALAVASCRAAEARVLLSYGAWAKEPPQRRAEILQQVKLQGGQMLSAFVAEGAVSGRVKSRGSWFSGTNLYFAT
ncbi:unnamed protein product, partial [Effrenium voratum]